MVLPSSTVGLNLANLPSIQQLLSKNKTLLSLLLLPPILYHLHADYLSYLSLGAGGLPHNLVGWLISNFCGLFARETLSTGIYSGGGESALQLPPRRGPRPTLGRHSIPQRQTTQLGSAAVLNSALAALCAATPSTLGTSRLEWHGLALFVRAEGTPNALEGEVVHVHDIDGSAHVFLGNDADCREVLEKGWGERHGLAGVLLPKGFLLVYAPRDEEEASHPTESGVEH
jgi:hypothetical protein